MRRCGAKVSCKFCELFYLSSTSEMIPVCPGSEMSRESTCRNLTKRPCRASRKDETGYSSTEAVYNLNFELYT